MQLYLPLLSKLLSCYRLGCCRHGRWNWTSRWELGSVAPATKLQQRKPREVFESFFRPVRDIYLGTMLILKSKRLSRPMEIAIFRAELPALTLCFTYKTFHVCESYQTACRIRLPRNLRGGVD